MSRARSGNEAGSAEDRRRRRQWLIENFRADQTIVTGRKPTMLDGDRVSDRTYGDGSGLAKLWQEWGYVDIQIWPACRCWRCGNLLTIDTLTVDRVVPACMGGRYTRDNIRPACSRCQSITGNVIKKALVKR